MNKDAATPKRALCLSGGGILGYFSACFLAECESAISSPLASRFDLIAGTSVGGITALAIAAELPLATIVTFFEEHGPRIFSALPPPKSTFGHVLALAKNITTPKYTGDELKSALEHLFGRTRTIGDLKHRIVIPALNMSSGSTKVFKTPHHERFFADHCLNVVDVALATSAAPTLFPIAEIGDELYIDGGLFANAPDLIAYHELKNFLGARTEEIWMLSVGTTTNKYSLPHRSGRHFGLYKWMIDARLISTMIASQQQLTTFMMRHMLGERYIRIDNQPSMEQGRQLKIDSANPQSMRDLRGLAAAAWRDQGLSLSSGILRDVVPPAIFFHGPGK